MRVIRYYFIQNVPMPVTETSSRRSHGCHVCLICVAGFASCAELKEHYVKHIEGIIADCETCEEVKQEAPESEPAEKTSVVWETFPEPTSKNDIPTTWVSDFETKDQSETHGPEEIPENESEDLEDNARGQDLPWAFDDDQVEQEATFEDAVKDASWTPKTVEKSLKTISTPSNPIKTDRRCIECGFLAKNAHLLSRHVNKVHRGMSYHPCPECDYEARKTTHLKEHIKTMHYQVKDLLCDQCPYVTGRKGALKKHKLVRHKGLLALKTEKEQIGE